jgi:cyanophycinase
MRTRPSSCATISAKVIGERAVTIDAGGVEYTNLPRLEQNQSLALSSVKLHVLPHGYRFDLKRRRPIIEAGAAS